MIGHWTHQPLQAQLSQALHSGGESSKPALLTRITSIWGAIWRTISSAGQLLMAAQKVNKICN